MTTCIELIVYLEPSAEFKHQVEHFLDSCKTKYGPTTANKYGCHITMTGFFNVDTEDDEMRVKQLLDASLKDLHKASPPSPQVERKSLLARNKTTQEPIHLLLPISVSEDFHVAMENLSRKCASIATLRLKKINHISLAYWDEPEATQEQQEHWRLAVAEQGLFENIQHDADMYFGGVKDPLYWDVVLYQRAQKGSLVGESHVFRELGRWRV
ncbi:SWI/SNF chromatin-remodeling complex subunit [Mucor velutinosus]|uniref:SWI/SNF chromatin-remodeling complex subunit n=1 Tax=Mucor velutinosus TaxID=708070 RepID=A0AAN7HZT4_9FUNG|nr:SWI/SNF chromatin-remodeling complex subunit [Mucor velutinosus]